MLIDADDKMIVKRMLILLGIIAAPICIMLLAEAMGLNGYPMYERIIGVLLLVAGVIMTIIMVRHIKQTIDGMLIMWEFVLMTLIYLALGFLFVAGVINI
jgi:hypothetical protein